LIVYFYINVNKNILLKDNSQKLITNELNKPKNTGDFQPEDLKELIYLSSTDQDFDLLAKALIR
jgi:hypothetical protein